MLETHGQKLMEMLFVDGMYFPLMAILWAFCGAWIAARLLNNKARQVKLTPKNTFFRVLMTITPRLPVVTLPLLTFFAMMLLKATPSQALKDSSLVPLAINLSFVWLLSTLIWCATASRSWTTWITATASTLLILHFIGMLRPLVVLLDSWPITIGSKDITLYHLLKTLLFFTLLLYGVRKLLHWAEHQLHRFSAINVNTRELLFKTAQIGLYYLLLVALLDLLGFSPTSLTIFSGAAFVAIGLAAQKTVANFFSGLQLLFERSIKIGDVVELSDGSWAWVRQMGARATLFECFDGKKLVMPNEELATKPFTNLTYHHRELRLQLNITLPYEVELDRAQEIIVEALKKVPSLSKKIPPRCFLSEFGPRGAGFIIHVWVDDVTKGRFLPQSEALFAVWRALREVGISLPYQVYEASLTQKAIDTERVDSIYQFRKTPMMEQEFPQPIQIRD